MLDERQIKNLAEICSSWISELTTPASELVAGETSFTSSYLLPWLTKKVSSLNRTGLYVRGDGGPSVRPLIWENFSFYPDLAIVEGEKTYIAFEVKILGGADAGGGLTKGIGQTALYSNLGYSKSFGLFFEQRFTRSNEQNLKWHSEVISGEKFSA